MKRDLKLASIVGLMFITSTPIHAAIILTFDDVPGANPGTNTSVIPNGYGGLNWQNMNVLHNSFHPGSGYANGVVSGAWVAFPEVPNVVASAADSLFHFHGAYLTAAWNNGLNVDVKGWLSGSEKYSQTVVVNTTGPTWFDFDYLGVDKVTFLGYGGVNAGLGGDGTYFAMDDFTTSIPVPGAALLAGLGACIVGWVRKRHVH